jgi:hypothetical protein
MGEVDAVERAVLLTLAELGLGPETRHRKNSWVLADVESRHGIAPAYGWQALVYMSRWWMLNVPLVDFQGNNGTPSNPPSEPRYTESRLSPFGALVAAAEQASDHQIPVRLINGTLYSGGTEPPFDPERVIEALSKAAAGTTDPDTLAETLGAPSIPTGCTTEADLPRLFAGERVEALLKAQIAHDQDRIVVSGFPPPVGDEEAANQIAGLADQPRFQQIIREVINSSRWNINQVEVWIHPGADPARLIDHLHTAWPFVIEQTLQLHQPLQKLVQNQIEQLGNNPNDALHQLRSAIHHTP